MTTPFWTGPKPFGEQGWIIEYKFGLCVVGDVMWFGPPNPDEAEHFFPHLHNRRFGTFGDLAGAKRRVEERALLPVEARQ